MQGHASSIRMQVIEERDVGGGKESDAKEAMAGEMTEKRFKL